jgi:hypothetical protein
MNAIDAMLALLIKALHDPPTRKETVKQFQSLVWQEQKSSVCEEVYIVLADLAYDLDFFELDPVSRVQDTAYYGHQRMEEEIKAAFRRLADLGIQVPYERSMRGDRPSHI